MKIEYSILAILAVAQQSANNVTGSSNATTSTTRNGQRTTTIPNASMPSRTVSGTYPSPQSGAEKLAAFPLIAFVAALF